MNLLNLLKQRLTATTSVSNNEEVFLLKDKEQQSRIISVPFDDMLKAGNKDFVKKYLQLFKQITSKNHNWNWKQRLTATTSILKSVKTVLSVLPVSKNYSILMKQFQRKRKTQTRVKESTTF